MSNINKTAEINQTFIVEPFDGTGISACTDFYSNTIISCTGNTSILLGNDTVIFNGNILANNITGTTFYGDGSYLTGISTQDTFVTGGTYNPTTGTAVYTNNTGGTFSVTGFNTSDSSGSFTGGTVSGGTIFTDGLTANTISATTYFNLPLDIQVTGLTFNNSNYDISIYNNNGVSYTTNLSILASDMTITGGTYNPTTGVVTFTNNTGGTFNVNGFLTGFTDIQITGGTYSAGTAVYTNNTGGTFSVTGFSTSDSFSGGTVSGATIFTDGLTTNAISATTYFNLPLDIRVTGGTYSAGTAVYTNNTGGTFSVTGFNTTNSFSGGTVSGGTIFTNGLTANTISATTYFNLPLDIQLTGGTYSAGTAIYTNNTGGTFSVTGFSDGLNWYAEPSTPPIISPIVSGINTIAIGDGAQAIADNVFSVGQSAGANANNANDSNFLGNQAGYQGTNASHSNFLGSLAGYSATSASYSNFIGYSSGYLATNASFSNFIGIAAGYNATNANNSNFIGTNAGENAINASYSNFLGHNSGSGSTGSNNIIIGSNITSINKSNSINIGGILFGSNSYSGVTGDILTGTTGFGKIGINVVNPIEVFHVSGNTLINGSLTANTISATTYFNLPLDIRVTGGTYSAGTAVYTNNTGGTFSVTGFNTTNSFSGGTVSGGTIFTNGLTANTISATTYNINGTDKNILFISNNVISGNTNDISWDYGNKRLFISNTNSSSFYSAQTGTLLHLVSNSNTFNGRVSLDTYFSGATGSIFQGRKARGTNLLPTAAQRDDTLSLVGGDGYGTTGFHNTSVGAYLIKAEQTFSDSSAPTYLSFFTSPTGSTSSTERWRITSSGGLTNTLTGTTYSFDVSGNSLFRNGLSANTLATLSGDVQSQIDGKQAFLGYTPENSANKTSTVVGNTGSTSFYLTVKGYYDYLIGMTWLTDSIFGTFLNSLSGKTTPLDADLINIIDTADSNKAKKVTFTNIKAFLKTYFDTLYIGASSVLTTVLTGFSASAGTVSSLDTILSALNKIVGNTTANTTALTLRRLTLFCDTPTTSVTGVAVKTAFGSPYKIDGGTLTNYSQLVMNAQASKSGGTGVSIVSFYINTTSNFATSTEIARLNATTTMLYVALERHYLLKGGNIKGWPFTLTIGTDLGTSATAWGSTAYNLANDLWIWIGVTPNAAAETHVLESVTIEAVLNKT